LTREQLDAVRARTAHLRGPAVGVVVTDNPNGRSGTVHEKAPPEPAPMTPAQIEAYVEALERMKQRDVAACRRAAAAAAKARAISDRPSTKPAPIVVTVREGHGRPRQANAPPSGKEDQADSDGDADLAALRERVERHENDTGGASVRTERRLRNHEGQLEDLWDLAADYGERLAALERGAT
jgi:hypothetical protein